MPGEFDKMTGRVLESVRGFMQRSLAPLSERLIATDTRVAALELQVRALRDTIAELLAASK